MAATGISTLCSTAMPGARLHPVRRVADVIDGGQAFGAHGTKMVAPVVFFEVSSSCALAASFSGWRWLMATLTLPDCDHREDIVGGFLQFGLRAGVMPQRRPRHEQRALARQDRRREGIDRARGIAIGHHDAARRRQSSPARKVALPMES